MYAKGKFYAKYFTVNKAPTERTFYGTISESILVGEVDGRKEYEYDNWFARFVGKAYEKAKLLQDGDNIIVKEWICRNPKSSNSEELKTFPHIRIVDFDVREEAE